MKKYFQKEIECASPEQIRSIQNEKFMKQIKRVWDNVAFYRKKMEDVGLDIRDIKSIDDITKLPFVTKSDLRENYPYSFLGDKLKDCVRIHATSGTTGKRTLGFFTQNDLNTWANRCARAFTAYGIGSDDIVQIAYGYGLFTGGFGIHGGSEKMGCLTIPISSGNTDLQIQFMQDLHTTCLCCTPSYAQYLAESIKEKNLIDNIKLRIGVFGAEAWSEAMRKDIEESLRIKAYDIYGLTELGGPGVAYECEEQNGMHINEDDYFVETINSDTLEQQSFGEKGELVFTNLSSEAFPIIRYRTRDISILLREKCSCGRTFIKMNRPFGRSDDMLIIRGVNVFPSQIEEILIENGCTSNYQIVVDRVNNTDTIKVLVEINNDNFTDSLSQITALEKKLEGELKSSLGISITVKFVAPKSIQRSEGKAIRVIDNRNI